MLKKVGLGFLLLLVAVYAAAALVPLDPEEQRPGTRLSGDHVYTPVSDWSFVQPGQKVWVQTNTWYGIPHSVTTVSFVVNDKLYIPCGWCATKRWPKNVAADPEVVVKIADKLYPLTAEKVNDQAFIEQIFSRMDIPADGVAVYRMNPRS